MKYLTFTKIDPCLFTAFLIAKNGHSCMTNWYALHQTAFIAEVFWIKAFWTMFGFESLMFPFVPKHKRWKENSMRLSIEISWEQLKLTNLYNQEAVI